MNFKFEAQKKKERKNKQIHDDTKEKQVRELTNYNCILPANVRADNKKYFIKNLFFYNSEKPLYANFCCCGVCAVHNAFDSDRKHGRIHVLRRKKATTLTTVTASI